MGTVNKKRAQPLGDGCALKTHSLRKELWTHCTTGSTAMQDNFSEKKSIADERNDLLEFLAVMNKRNNDIVMRLKSECLELRVIGKTQEKTHQLVVDYAQDYQSFNDNAEQRLCDVYYKYFNKENGNG